MDCAEDYSFYMEHTNSTVELKIMGNFSDNTKQFFSYNNSFLILLDIEE